MRKLGLLHFWRGERAVSAVEFALIAPVMLVLFFGGVELGSALVAARKAQTVASSVADLVAQGKTINDSQVNDIFTAANALMTPYDPTKITIVVSSIYFDINSNQTKVRWSKALNASPLAPNTVVALPAGILTNNSTSVIMSSTTYFYKTDFGQFLTQGVTMYDTFYSRPRLSTEVVYQ
jgi:Flp pilus assembly protein TadG